LAFSAQGEPLLPQSCHDSRQQRGANEDYCCNTGWITPNKLLQTVNLLMARQAGTPEATEELMKLIYSELRELARAYMHRERPGHTLQATTLVHEVYIRLWGTEPIDWKNSAHFFAVAAQLGSNGRARRYEESRPDAHPCLVVSNNLRKTPPCFFCFDCPAISLFLRAGPAP